MGDNANAGINRNLANFNQFANYAPAMSKQLMSSAKADINSATGRFDPWAVMKNLRPAEELANRTFYNKTMPNLMEKYGASSGGSGSMNRAMMEAGKDLSLGLSAQAQPYLFEGQQNQLNRQLQGAGSGLSPLSRSYSASSSLT